MFVLSLVRDQGCTGLISAGYKITWDKGAEGEEVEEDEGEAKEVRYGFTGDVWLSLQKSR